MKKIGLIVKETTENQIKNSLKEINGVFIVKYPGISSPDLCILRQSLKQANARLFVVKNSVARRALKDSSLSATLSAIEGPCGLVFAKDSGLSASKVLYEFTKEHEKLKLEAGVVEGRVLGIKDIERIAKLPSLEILRMLLVVNLKSPITGLVMALSQTLRKIVVCLDQIKTKKTN